MRNPQELAISIKEVAKRNKTPVGKMLSDCGLSVNTLSSMQSGGYFPRLEAITKIADYLNCSIDYLLGRTDNPEINGSVSVVNNGTGSVGFNHGTVTVNGVSEECAELVRIYASLDIRQRVRLLNMAIEVADGAT